VIDVLHVKHASSNNTTTQDDNSCGAPVVFEFASQWANMARGEWTRMPIQKDRKTERQKDVRTVLRGTRPDGGNRARSTCGEKSIRETAEI
jgi:hypothetical protein